MNGHPNIDPNEATEHLKNILNVGKADNSQGKTKAGVMKMETSDVSDFVNETTFQRIELTAEEENVAIYGSDVSIYSSPLQHGVNSSNIMLCNIVDYGWEQKYYLGRLVSVHLSKRYLAYSLKAPTHHGFVRVIKNGTNTHLLIRGFQGGVQDLSFAHSLFRIMLGCVDEIGELFVYEIFDEDVTLTNRLCLHIIRPNNTPHSIYHRLTWCPYIPEDSGSWDNSELGQDEDAMMMSSLIVVTHNEKAEIWNIDMVMKEYGTGDLPIEKVKTGLQIISQHKQPITTTAFSPDALALATASLDGEIKFFEVNVEAHEATPKCLHEWAPHSSKPLSSLFFLDNLKTSTPDAQFWKYAITGADNNQEIKIWSCKTWNCLQTIRFLPSKDDNLPPCLKAEVDLSANHLILSDINRKVLYILKISQGNNAQFSSLSEYWLKYPALSFSVLDIIPYKGKASLNLKNSVDDDDDEDEKDDDYDDSDGAERKHLSYVVKLFWIHTKSFQACRIMYSPKTDSPLNSNASISSSQDSFVYKDGLSDISADVADQIGMSDHMEVIRPPADAGISPNQCLPAVPPPASVLASATVSSAVAPCLTSNYQECSEILLTPKDFTSLHSSLPPITMANSFKITDVEEVTDQLIDRVCDQNEITAIDAPHGSRTRRKSSQHSCASSPSREVAEILSPSQILSHENEDDSPQVKENGEMSSISGNGTVICHSPVVKLQPEFTSNDWPQAPDPNKEYKLVPRSDGDIHLSHPSLEQNSLRHALADGDISPEDLLTNSSNNILQRLERAIESLTVKVASVADALQRQNQALQYVQSDIQNLQQQQKFIHSNVQNLEALDSAVSAKVAHIISENSINDFSRLENLVGQRNSEDIRHYEQQSAALAEDVVTAVSNCLDKVLKREMKSTVIPHMSAYLDSLVQRLQGEFLQKLNSTDNALKECVSKHLRSKAFGDNLATTTANLLQHSIQAACKDVFQNSVMPSMDKCCHLLFSQMSEVFTKGSIEYVEKLDRHLQITSSNQETMTKRCEEEIHKLVADTQNNFAKLSAKAQESTLESAKEHEKLISKIRQVVQEEVHRSLKDHHSALTISAMRSHQSTPAPQSDPQISPKYIVQLAKQGQMNEAFQQALSAMDIKLVLFLCESVPVEQVFEPVPCPLAQHVLLSLIQQLSGDINEKTDIKLRYIEDAIASLDSSNPITREHIGQVLGVLKQRISAFMKQNPSHKMVRICKRILLAIDSFLK